MTDRFQSKTDTNPEIRAAPILLIPYQWIGDFVRCHSVVRLLRERFPDRAIDVLTTPLCAPLLDYMPGVRKGTIAEIPRGTLPLGRIREVAGRLRAERYGTALVMPRTWKAALAPFLAGIPERVGFVGEARFGLINDIRFGERRLPRMIDRCAALALPRGGPLRGDWPLPQIVVPEAEVAKWRAAKGLADETRPTVALCPGAVGPGKRWPTKSYAELAQALTARGCAVWVLGGPAETALAAEIVRDAGPLARDLTSNDLRNAILAFKAVQAAVSNNSGLLHVAAAIGTPSVGIFGPTDPWLWGPLNPVSAIVEPRGRPALFHLRQASLRRRAPPPHGRHCRFRGPARRRAHARGADLTSGRKPLRTFPGIALAGLRAPRAPATSSR